MIFRKESREVTPTETAMDACAKLATKKEHSRADSATEIFRKESREVTPTETAMDACATFATKSLCMQRSRSFSALSATERCKGNEVTAETAMDACAQDATKSLYSQSNHRSRACYARVRFLEGSGVTATESAVDACATLATGNVNNAFVHIPTPTEVTLDETGIDLVRRNARYDNVASTSTRPQPRGKGRLCATSAILESGRSL